MVDNEFFIGLPQGKMQGFCEPSQGDIHNSVVVFISPDCQNCIRPECHMFKPVVQDGRVVARVFKNHPPEYR